MKNILFSGAVVALTAGLASASGFALIEQSVSGLGNAYAGGAAIAEDASTVFFNPAGMTRLPGTQCIAGANLIAPSARFRNEGSTHVLQQVTGAPLAGNNGGDGGETAVTPNLYLTRRINDRLTLGLGISAPFGLATDYNDTWVGRYYALRSELKTVNLNPSIAYRLNEHLSIGAGLSAEYIKAKLSNAIDFGTLDAVGFFAPLGLTRGQLRLVPQMADGFASMEGDDWSAGFNLGLLYEKDKDTRVGVSYRSRIKHTLTGTVDFSNVPAGLAATPLFKNGGISADITLPDVLSVSMAHRITPAWTVMGDVTWTHWSLFNELRVRFDNPYQPDSVTTTDWRDSFRYSAGVAYAPGNNWTWRLGIAYDQTPVRNAQTRTPRIPDGDRIWTALGLGYKASDRVSFDAGYAHLFVNDPAIAKTPTGEDASRGGLTGSYSAHVNIVSAQATIRF